VGCAVSHPFLSRVRRGPSQGGGLAAASLWEAGAWASALLPIFLGGGKMSAFSALSEMAQREVAYISQCAMDRVGGYFSYEGRMMRQSLQSSTYPTVVRCEECGRLLWDTVIGHIV